MFNINVKIRGLHKIGFLLFKVSHKKVFYHISANYITNFLCIYLNSQSQYFLTQLIQLNTKVPLVGLH